jgi:competence protein ComEC
MSNDRLSLMKLVRRRSTKITAACTTGLVGLALGRVGWSMPLLIILALAVIAILIRKTSWAVVAVAALGLVAGIWRGHEGYAANQNMLAMSGRQVVMQGTVSDDPATSDKNYTQFNLSVPSAAADIPVRTYFVELQRGFTVQITGKLEAGYGGKPVQFGFAQIQIVSRDQSWLEHIRQRFIAGMRTVLPEPLAGFALGLLVGARALIPKDLQTQLTLVGLSHLVAVSGYNLTILVEAARKLLGRASRYVQLALPLWLIGGFAVVTGFSPSIVRAGLVSVLSLVAAHYGRRIKPLVLVSFAALATAVWQPNYLVDLGWQLSFAAFFGILVVAPLVEREFGKLHWLVATAVESLSAQVMTFPIILVAFGTLSLVAPFSNLLVLPLVPLAMLLSLIAGLVGMFLPAAGLLVWPAWALLTLMLKFITALSGLSWASINAQATMIVVVIFYAALLAFLATRYIRLASVIITSNEG